MVHDWSMHHVAYARSGPLQAMLAAQRDPRAGWSWMIAARSHEWQNAPRPAPPGFPHEPVSPDLRADWSINLGAAGTAAAMYPAKYSFDVNAAVSGPANLNSCLNDFVVYPVNAAGTAAQPNLVGFNNLYSGTAAAGGIGICNRTAVGSDTGTAATVYWSYDINAVAGAVPTSPVLSLDGSKVAFVESVAGQPAHFHVLAWKSGDGKDATHLQNTLLPKVINAFIATAPVAGSGTATDLALGSSTTGTETISSPFIDYVRDVAYVGNDAGALYRIKDVFCTTDPACSGANPPAPSIDTSWGTAGAITVGPGSCAGTAASRLTGGVLDFVTLNVFVGCADGRLYGFNSSGAALSPASATVGEGTIASALGGIVDPPIVDGVNGFVYASSGSNGTNAVLVQTTTTLSPPIVATLGARRIRNLHSPVFDDDYFSSATSGTWAILSCGFNAAGNRTDLYAVGFNASRVMNAGTPPAANMFQIRTAADECAPLIEFLNTGTGIDWLFVTRIGAANIRNFNITAVTGAGFPGGFTNARSVAETAGTSGIIVDNLSTQAQASSIYFSRLGSSACGAGGTGRCAVKLTQGTLL
jgi:hypothetical protein